MALSNLLGMEITEHSCRREGAQFYTRAGVPENCVMWIGRWGSATVRLYIAEAVAQQAALAAQLATSSSSSSSSRSTSVALALIQFGSYPTSGREAPAHEGVDSRTVPPHFEIMMRQIANEAAHSVIASARAAQSVADADSTGAVLSYGHRGPKTHRVEVGAISDDRTLWRTVCGWRFGLSSAERRPVTTVDCKDCIRRQSKRLSPGNP